MCTRMCLCKCHPSSVSIHTLLCKPCFSCPSFFPFLSSPQEQRRHRFLKRPSLRGPPHPAGQVCVRAHALITHLFVCLHAHNMHVCPSILRGVTRSCLFHNRRPVCDSELDRNTYCRLSPSGWQ